MSNIKTFFLFFVVQFLYYGVLCWNYRAVAQANLLHVAISDGFAALIGFTLIKKVSAATSRAAMAGYVLGGMLGSVVSVMASVWIFGK